MKMGRKDPRSSMSQSVKGKSPINPTGRNPFKSASPYETPGVGEGGVPKKSPAPQADPVADAATDSSTDD